MDIQAQIPAALATIHNYIRIHDHEEGDLLGILEDFKDCYRHPFDTPGRQDPPENLMINNNDPAQLQHAEIAQAMWQDYQRIFHEQAQIDDYLYDDDNEEDRYDIEEQEYGDEDDGYDKDDE